MPADLRQVSARVALPAFEGLTLCNCEPSAVAI